jgi:hypothetical protein
MSKTAGSQQPQVPIVKDTRARRGESVENVAFDKLAADLASMD